MGLVARRDLQDGGLDLGKALLLEPRPERPRDRGPRLQLALILVRGDGVLRLATVRCFEAKQRVADADPIAVSQGVAGHLGGDQQDLDGRRGGFVLWGGDLERCPAKAQGQHASASFPGTGSALV